MRCLFLDIETSPLLLAAFGIYDQHRIPYDHVFQESFMICAAWQWLDEKRISSVSIIDDVPRWAKDHTDDYHVVKSLYDQIVMADVVIGHNIKQFDMKKFMGRVVYHKLPPFNPPQMVDTLKEARKCKFTSHKLGDLGKYLKLGNKLETEKGLWLRAAQGDARAIKAMVKYNRGDIPPLVKLYERLRPYMVRHPNRNLFSDVACCPKCGHTKYQQRGWTYTAVSQYRKYQCLGCHGWFSGATLGKRVLLK